MSKLKFLESFKNAKSRYGSYAALLTAVVLAVLLVINLLASQIPLRLDLTRNKLYSLSEQSYEVLKDLDKDVKITALYETGKEAFSVQEILFKYQAASDNISVDFIDPIRFPQVVEKYGKGGQTLKMGSIIVESGDRFKVILPDDMIAQYGGYLGEEMSDYLVIEEKITSSIMNVASDESYIIYALQKHGEESLKVMGLEKYLQNENYEVRDLDLLTEEAVPEDASAVLVMAPQVDLHPEEDQRIRDYLDNGGRAIFLMNPTIGVPPLFNELFKTYGVQVTDEVAYEESGSHALTSNPIAILPDMSDHEIVSPIKNKGVRVLIPGAKGIQTLDTKRRSVEVFPLLQTSNKAYGVKMDGSKGSMKGPINVAVAISDKKYGQGITETRIVLISNKDFVESSTISKNAVNLDFFMNSVNWLQDRKESLSIRVKSVESAVLRIDAFNAYLFAGIVVIVIPLAMLIAGFVVWLKRRHL